MKKLIYTIAFVALGLTSSYAQESKRKVEGREGKTRMETRHRQDRDSKLTSEQRAEKSAQTMQKRLNLSEEQTQKIKSIQLDRIKKSEEWRKEDHKAFKNKMEERKAFMSTTKEKMDKVLTDEQRKSLASARENSKERMREGRSKRLRN